MKSIDDWDSLLASYPENIYGHKRKNRFIIERLRLWQGHHRRSPKILDVGCGTGRVVTATLGRAGYDILGIDLDEPTIREAISSNVFPNVSFEVRHIDDIDTTFDVVLLTEVLEHLSDPGQMLQSCIRRLQPEGVLLITVPNGWGPFEVEKALWKLLRMDSLWTNRLLPLLKRLKSLGKNTLPKATNHPWNSLDTSPHVQFFTVRSFANLMQKNGLQIRAKEKSSWLAGPFSALTLARSKMLIEANSKMGSLLPMWAVNGFYFEVGRAGIHNDIIVKH